MRLTVPRYAGVRGLPARAVTVSNSERTKFVCLRRGWFAYIERLKSGNTRPRSFGNAWHSCVEDVHRYWMIHDSAYEGDGLECVWCGPDGCTECEGSELGPVAKYRAELLAASLGDSALYTTDEVDGEIARLSCALDGYLRTYGREPYKSYKVIGVEVPLCRMITNPRSGRPYAPEMYYVREGRILRLAATGEVSGETPLPDGATTEVHRWPWYQVAKLDCIIQHRTTGVIYVDEWKSSASPKTLIEGLNVDPQTDGYVWVLEDAIERGLFGLVRGEVRGYLYDVTSSTPHRSPALLAPKPVKRLHPETGEPWKVKGKWQYLLDDDGAKIERTPGLSKATNKTIPSWRYEAAIAEHGFDPAEYREVVAHYRATVNPKLYQREFGSCGPEPRARYAEEIYASARQLADLYRKAARARDMVDVNVAFPRVPVCRLPGGACSYRGPCMADGEEARNNYEKAETQVWEYTK